MTNNQEENREALLRQHAGLCPSALRQRLRQQLVMEYLKIEREGYDASEACARVIEAADITAEFINHGRGYDEALLEEKWDEQVKEAIAKETAGESQEEPRWIDNPGYCPVVRGVKVEVEYRSGERHSNDATSYRWRFFDNEHDIIAYRVLTPGQPVVAEKATTVPDADGFFPLDGKSWPDCSPDTSIFAKLKSGRIERGRAGAFTWNWGDINDWQNIVAYKRA